MPNNDSSSQEIWVYEVVFDEPIKQVGSCHFVHEGQRCTQLKAARMFTYHDRTCLYLIYDFVNGWGESYFDEGSYEEMVRNAMDEANRQFGITNDQWKRLV